MRSVFQYTLTHADIDYEKPRHSSFNESHNHLLFEDEELAFQDIKKHLPEFMDRVVFGTSPDKMWKDSVKEEKRDNMYSREPFQEPEQKDEWKAETWEGFFEMKKCDTLKELESIIYEIQDRLDHFDEGSTIRLGKNKFELFEKETTK